MSHSRLVSVLFRLGLLFALAACGGSDGPTSSSPSATLSGTLAYVVNECRENAAGVVFHQTLLVRREERDPITVMEIPDIGPVPEPLRGFCRFTANDRSPEGLVAFGSLQRLAVSPDGSAVAFEVTDEFSQLGHNLLTPEQRGIFFIGADGTGLRRLGPPSRQASFFTLGDHTNLSDLVFSPDGRTLAFPDLGPGPDGEDAPQIIALDVATGARTQLTQLPPPPPAVDVSVLNPGGLCCPAFADNKTIAFFTKANPDGLNPHGEIITPVVNANGAGGLRLPAFPVALPGSQIDPRFVITGGQPRGIVLSVPGQPVNGGSTQFSYEVFFFDGGQNVLQLTNLHRRDTFTFGGDARQRVNFVASADPLGTNPSGNCQVFSIASLGGDLRQLTQFQEADHSIVSCGGSGRRGLGCRIFPIGRDDNTGTLLFISGCDPFGTNPNGEQLFALGTDGSGLRQLTQARGLVVEAGGTVGAELIFPYAYSAGRSGL